jgi:hypothetical protein
LRFASAGVTPFSEGFRKDWDEIIRQEICGSGRVALSIQGGAFTRVCALGWGFVQRGSAIL